MILRWQRCICPETPFLVKVDDDVVVHVDRLAFWVDSLEGRLRETHRQKSLYCNVLRGSPFRDENHKQ